MSVVRPGGLAMSWPGVPSAVWAPFLCSRVLVWITGVTAMLVGHQARPVDPTGVTAQLSHTVNILAAPAVRWDGVWYLTIAQHGYTSAPLASFFPLYPVSVGALSWSTGSAIVVGTLISLVALLFALSVLYRLVELDFGARGATASVWLLALFPMSLFFSAIYTESLFLALSLSCVYLARRGRWGWAGVLGCLASATRSVGLVLIVPLVILYVSDRRDTARSSQVGAARGPGWRGLGAAALVPLGLVGYIAGLGVARGTPFGMFNSGLANRGLVAFPVTVIRQFRWTADKFGDLAGAGKHTAALLYAGIPELGFLALALVCAVGVVRRLHPAYAAYTIVMLLVLLSEPDIRDAPLTSFPRYVLVLFPLWVWLAVAASGRRIWRPLLGCSALLLVLFSAQFATWHFVA